MNKKYILLFCVGVILVAFSIWLSKLLNNPFGDIFAGAIVGVALTAASTMMLLGKQSEQELAKDLKGKVFGEKLEIYKVFLENLRMVLRKKEEPSDAEITDIKFQFAILCMHLDKTAQIEASNYISELINSSITEGGNIKIEDVLNLVYILRKDLYENSELLKVDKDKQVVKNFNMINSEPASETSIDSNESNKSEYSIIKTFNEELTRRLAEEGLNFIFGKSENILEMKLDNKRNYMRFVINPNDNTISLQVWLPSLEPDKRKEAYIALTKIGYPARYNTGWCEFSYPKERNDRYVNKWEGGDGVIEDLRKKDELLIKRYLEWIKYTNCETCKILNR